MQRRQWIQKVDPAAAFLLGQREATMFTYADPERVCSVVVWIVLWWRGVLYSLVVVMPALV